MALLFDYNKGEDIVMVRRMIENHSGYNVGVYEVDVDDNMRRVALQFAKEIILSDNQYSRLLPENVRNSNDISMQQKIEIQRTYMGKLGEIVFWKLLESKGKNVDIQGMFEVYEGQENVDSFDFETIDGKSVDVKSGFRTIHTRLLVNVQQFDRIPKDYYVGVKLNAQDTNSGQKLVDWNNITLATVKGYAEYPYMQNHAEVRDFGEGPARWLPYNKLMGIDIMIYKGKYYVLDAKCYRYGWTGNPDHLPNGTDINKQITYGEYIERVKSVPNDSLFNCFIMPYNKDDNLFHLNRNVGNIGEAIGDWRYDAKNPKMKNFERIQGIVMDTRYLMYNYIGTPEQQKKELAECIEKVLSRGLVSPPK